MLAKVLITIFLIIPLIVLVIAFVVLATYLQVQEAKGET